MAVAFPRERQFSKEKAKLQQRCIAFTATDLYWNAHNLISATNTNIFGITNIDKDTNTNTNALKLLNIGMHSSILECTQFYLSSIAKYQTTKPGTKKCFVSSNIFKPSVYARKTV